MSWKQRLIDARRMIKDARVTFYDAIVALVSVYRDREFLADCEAHGDNPEDRMDSECKADFGHPFGVILQVYEHFPNRGDWINRSLIDLVALWNNEKKAARPKLKYAAASSVDIEQESVHPAESFSPTANQGPFVEACSIVPIDQFNELKIAYERLKLKYADLHRKYIQMKQKIARLSEIQRSRR